MGRGILLCPAPLVVEIGSSSPVQLTSTVYCHQELLSLALLRTTPMKFFSSISKGVVTEGKKMMETKIDRNDTKQMQTSLGHDHRYLCQDKACSCSYGLFAFNQERGAGGYRGKKNVGNKNYRKWSYDTEQIHTSVVLFDIDTPRRKLPLTPFVLKVSLVSVCLLARIHGHPTPIYKFAFYA